MSSIKISGKELTAAFFRLETPNGSVWLCRCGKKCQQKGSGYTNLNAIIIHDDVFESAVQKILKGSEEELTPDESVKVTGLRNGTSPMEEETKTGEERDADAGLSLAEKALKRRRLVSTTTSASAFMDLHFIVPTSNMCERLFSEAGYGLNSRRMRTLPSNFESQLFLRTNKTFWGMAEINHNIMTNEGDEEKYDTSSS
ncbi:hypothetical protein IV203_005612 [Nitzschia inconspicua]|uniref:HAT C-terminal dimerisation domain-containing protein n=1 Tax=Nitzschia inconspicua TaxID=303405 RepID=A0A9K3PIW0_9STRA|nr:hypothetical protein IV203_005612 [Nitzschia inconspicua]